MLYEGFVAMNLDVNYHHPFDVGGWIYQSSRVLRPGESVMCSCIRLAYRLAFPQSLATVVTFREVHRTGCHIVVGHFVVDAVSPPVQHVALHRKRRKSNRGTP